MSDQYVRRYEDIPDLQEVLLSQGQGLALIGVELLYVRCTDPGCKALHILITEEAEGPYIGCVAVGLEELKNMVEIAELIQKGKQQ